LAAINSLLGEKTQIPARPKAHARPKALPQPKRQIPKPEVSLTSLITDALKGGPKTKQQILDAVVKKGYKFAPGRSHLVTLDSVIYTKKFTHKDKLFTLAGRKAPAKQQAPKSPAKARK
jgi:hypothetical protein